MRKFFAVAVVAATTLAWPAAAQTSYPDFSSTAGLQINGDAYQNGNKLTLTPALEGQSGSAFSLNTISLGSNASFSTVFSFEILNRGGIPGSGINGADGLTFTMQTNANNVGGGGGGIGYQGIDNSVAVEFDTYQNFEHGDISSNHVGINQDGSVVSNVSIVELTDFDNAATWWAWIDYDGSIDRLDVRWAQSSVRPAPSMLFTFMDLPTILEGTDVFVGFTSGTGAGWGEHNILSWNFVNTFQEGGADLPTTIPEPGTIFLMATGLGLTMICRRLRRRGRSVGHGMLTESSAPRTLINSTSRAIAVFVLLAWV